MRNMGAAVIEDHGWIDRIATGAVVGFVVFLFTKLWDAFQFERKMTEAIRMALSEFKENNVTPLKERQSKSEATVKEMQSDIAETKQIVAAIAAKLEVKLK